METVLVQFRAPGRTPTLAEAKRILRVDDRALDSSFGVVPVEPDLGVYAVLARADGAPEPGGPSDVRLFADPPVAPLGPGKGIGPSRRGE